LYVLIDFFHEKTNEYQRPLLAFAHPSAIFIMPVQTEWLRRATGMSCSLKEVQRQCIELEKNQPSISDETNKNSCESLLRCFGSPFFAILLQRYGGIL
jgi:hypothetical protein